MSHGPSRTAGLGKSATMHTTLRSGPPRSRGDHARLRAVPERGAAPARRRSRHLPRLCGTCQAPMASAGDTCWRCGAPWAARAAAQPNDEACSDAERWTNEGGSFRSDTSTARRGAVRPER